MANNIDVILKLATNPSYVLSEEEALILKQYHEKKSHDIKNKNIVEKHNVVVKKHKTED